MIQGDAHEGLILPAFQKRSEAARDRLLQAAEREFARHGFNSAIVADIAREAGCSIGSFYRRFKDKEALFFALQARMHASASRDLDRFFDNPRRAEQSLQAVFRQLVINTFRGMNDYAGYFRAFVELTQSNAMVWSRMTELEAQQSRRIASMAAERGYAADSPALVEKAHLATRTVNGFVITHLLYRPEQFAPVEPLVVERLASVFFTFLDLPPK